MPRTVSGCVHQKQSNRFRFKRYIYIYLSPSDPAMGWLFQPTLMVICVLNHIHGAQIWIGTPHGRRNVNRLLMVCEIGAIQVAAIAYLKTKVLRNGCVIYIYT